MPIPMSGIGFFCLLVTMIKFSREGGEIKNICWIIVQDRRVIKNK